MEGSVYDDGDGCAGAGIGRGFSPEALVPTIRPGMFRQVPNLLTAGRLVLGVVFFIMLSFYQYKGRGDSPDHWLLHWAFLTYFIALITDFLDGYLARKWKIESAFGRIVDPFVDKVLVLGSFIFFAGKNFVIPETEHSMVVKTITGVAPGIVVILLARELLITVIRSGSESSGKSFGAAFSGKLKMAFQSGTILIILLYVNYYDWVQAHAQPTARWVRDIGIWGTVAITVISGGQYLYRAMPLFFEKGKHA